MRALVTGLVATCLVASSGDAAARSEWVVLRVERVEVAAAHADGTPWDDDSPTGETCGVLGGGADLASSSTWGPVVKRLCPGGKGSDPHAPDLVLHLAVPHDVEYVSPIVADVLAHDFRYDILVPIDALAAQGFAITVMDKDGSDPGEELLGAIQITRRDIGHLLAGSHRVKTYADDSVTRIDVSARRYRPAKREMDVSLRAGQRAAREPVRLIAGEQITIRVSPGKTAATAVIGGNLNSIAFEGCTRGVVQASGGLVVGLDDPARISHGGTTFAISVGGPTLDLWLSGMGGLSCDRKVSLVAIKDLQALSTSTLAAVAVRAILRSRYLQGVQRCHERTLGKQLSSTGRVDARFTVGPTGGVTKATVKGFDEALDDCIKMLMNKWRFGAPKDDDGKSTSEDFDMSLRLGEL